jgi:mannose-1-phosphate guanylyltransferase
VASLDYAVILAGGRGERFWPLSRIHRPKQLLSLVGDSSLLAQAAERLQGLIDPERVFVITSADLVEASRAAAPNLPPANILGEPVGRDTAAAAALGAALVQSRDPDAAFCVLTADHVIGDLGCFRRTLREGLALARQRQVLVTIGIQPDHPSTGYGYIEAGDPFHNADGIAFFQARRFVEKPPVDKARAYLDAGNYFWNSGMFIWSAETLIAGLRRHRPPLADAVDAWAAAARTGSLERALAETYPSLEKISIDYALMEKADNIVVARGEFAWDDVGSWPALANHLEADAAGNVVVGACEAVDSSGSIVVDDTGRLTALVGVEGLVVVHAEGVTLVCRKDRAQDVKKLVERLRGNPDFAHLL